MHGQINTTSPNVVKLTGRDLDRRVRKAGPAERALLACDLEQGRVTVDRLTAKQARILASASFGYARTVRGLTEHERSRVRFGFVNLSQFHNVTPDGAVFKFIDKVGADRVLRALDVLTAPRSVAAE